MLGSNKTLCAAGMEDIRLLLAKRSRNLDHSIITGCLGVLQSTIGALVTLPPTLHREIHSTYPHVLVKNVCWKLKIARYLAHIQSS